MQLAAAAFHITVSKPRFQVQVQVYVVTVDSIKNIIIIIIITRNEYDYGGVMSEDC